MTDEVFTDRHLNDPPFDGGDIDWAGASYETFKANLDRYNRETTVPTTPIDWDELPPVENATALAFKFAMVERHAVDDGSEPGALEEKPAAMLYNMAFRRSTGDPIGLTLVVDDQQFIIPVIPYDPALHISGMDGLAALREWMAER